MNTKEIIENDLDERIPRLFVTHYLIPEAEKIKDKVYEIWKDNMDEIYVPGIKSIWEQGGKSRLVNLNLSGKIRLMNVSELEKISVKLAKKLGIIFSSSVTDDTMIVCGRGNRKLTEPSYSVPGFLSCMRYLANQIKDSEILYIINKNIIVPRESITFVGLFELDKYISLVHEEILKFLGLLSDFFDSYENLLKLVEDKNYDLLRKTWPKLYEDNN